MKKSGKRQAKTLYFDYAATSPITDEAKREVNRYYSADFGNPGSIHKTGMSAIAALDNSRELFSKILGSEFRGTVFTGSATEANNLALRGVAKKYARRPEVSDDDLPARIIISSAEHDSVDAVAEKLGGEGCEIVRIPVGRNGLVGALSLGEAINKRTALVSLIYTNNETGAINDVKKAGEIIKAARGKNIYPLFHIDASQSFQYSDCRFTATGADIMTLSAHKMGGPKGVGALCFSNAEIMRHIEPIIVGGGQEFGMRSGTENFPAIAGFAAALSDADKRRKGEHARIMEIKKSMWREISKIFPMAKINGQPAGEGSPHILNVWLPGNRSDDVVIGMDMRGIMISAGSACAARTRKPSKVIKAMGYSDRRASESIRISFGRQTKKSDIKRFISAIKKTAGFSCGGGRKRR